MPSHKSQRALNRRTTLWVFLTVLGLMAGGVVTHSNGGAGRSLLRLREGGDARLIAFDPLPDNDGPMCQWLPATASHQLLATLLQQRQSAEMESSAAQMRPSDAAKAEAAKRPPVRTLRDPSAAFSAVAVDPLHDEVVLTDENNFGIMTYSRTENTPPSAKMSEPRRLIQGKSTMLEFNCSVYVDPASGDIYGVNNDTIDTLVVFNREARGNVPPTRKLYTPHTTYGIAVDEQAQEMFLTIQDDHAVIVYGKSAKEEDAPLRILQGSRTGLADPHGLAIDSKAGLLFVANWGTTNERPAPGTVPGGGSFGRGVTRTDWPIGRAKAFTASGKLLPASITVYAKDAKGDAAPLRVIQGPKTQLNWPTAVAVDSTHNELFVANDTGDSVTVYSYSASGDAAPGIDADYHFRADGDASKDAALINGFMKIVDRLTINGDKDANYRLRVNGDTTLNGLAKVISTLFLDAIGGNLYLRTASDKSVLGLTATQLRDELDVYSSGG